MPDGSRRREWRAASGGSAPGTPALLAGALKSPELDMSFRLVPGTASAAPARREPMVRRLNFGDN